MRVESQAVLLKTTRTIGYGEVVIAGRDLRERGSEDEVEEVVIYKHFDKKSGFLSGPVGQLRLTIISEDT
jgi:hypothetical protein